MSNKLLIVIAGPTAVGKTTIAVKIAQLLETEILSCDSRQLYKELNIGVAKPTLEELAAVKHHFINHISIKDKYNAGKYEREAIALIQDLFDRYDYLVMTGGTGLYIKAVLEGLDEFPTVLDEDKDHYTNILETEGISVLQNELKLKDPSYFQEVDINNARRLIRALSVIKSSGHTFSSYRNREPKQRNFKSICFQLTMDREELYKRINTRVDLMMEHGLLAEAKSFWEQRALLSLLTVGYQELFKHLDEQLQLNEAVDLIKRNSRRYAKRQITWFSNNGDFIKVNNADSDQILEIIRSKSS